MRKYLLLLSVIPFLQGCPGSTGKLQKSVSNTIEPIFPGYTLFDIPNTGDVPGTIYRKTPQGQKFYVTKLDLKLYEDSVQLRKLSGNRTSSFGLLVSFLGLPNLDLKANDTLKSINKVNYAFSVEGTPVKEYVTDLDWGSAYKKIIPIIQDDIKTFNRINDKYFVIRETIKSTNYKMAFDQNLTRNQAFNASIQKLVTLNNGFGYSSKDSLQLVFKGSTPYRIFHVDESLALTTGSDGKVDLIRKTVTEE
jgi:hypothetical protein